MTYLEEMARHGYSHESIGPFHQIMVPYVIRSLGLEPDLQIVDVGAAQGHCIIAAKRAGYRNLNVIDVEPTNFDLFEKNYQIGAYLCDVERERFPFEDGSIGALMAVHLIEHLSAPANFLSESLRVLRPGGAIVLVTPDWRKQYKTFWRDPTHRHPYDKPAISRLLRIHNFSEVRTSSWGSSWGLGRVRAYRLFPRLGLIGRDLLAVGFRPGVEGNPFGVVK